MKLLIISYAYPPAMSPRSFRWGALARQFVHEGHEVSVVTAWQPGLPRTQTMDGVQVQRVGNSTLANWRSRISFRNSYCDGKRGNVQPEPRRGSRWLTQLVRPVWRFLHWPDAHASFILPAYRAARRLVDENQYDLVISSSLPFSTHLAGLWLKRSRPAITWLVDIGDPFAFVKVAAANNRFLYGRVNRAAETAVLRAADHVSVTNAGAAVAYERYFQWDTTKLQVIPPLVTVGGLAKPIPTQKQDASSTVMWVYCGQFYRGLRSPVPLLETFQQMRQKDKSHRNHELHIYGDVSECSDELARSGDLAVQNVFIHGRVSHEEAIDAERRATVLVNVDNHNFHQLPSKVVEYLALGKPILNIETYGNGTSRAILHNHPLALTVSSPHTSPENVDRMSRFFGKLPASLSRDKIKDLCRPYQAKEIAGQYLKCARDGVANVRPKSFPFLQFRWRGMPVVGVPGSHDGLNDAVWRSFRAGSLRRELYARAVRMSGSWLRQRWWAHGVDTPLPYLAEGDFFRFIDHLRHRLEDDWLQPVISYPATMERKRFYLTLLSATGEPSAFVKVVHGKKLPHFGERELQAASSLQQDSVGHFRMPRTKEIGCFERLQFQVFEPIPVSARRPSQRHRSLLDATARVISKGTHQIRQLDSLGWWSSFERLRESIPELYRQVDNIQDRQVTVCRAHGDFQRPNAVWHQGELWVFDWEWFSTEAPLWTDKVRFFLGDRTTLLVRRPADVFSQLMHRFCGRDSDHFLTDYQQVALALAYIASQGNEAGEICGKLWKFVPTTKAGEHVDRYQLSESLSAA